jgi:K+ transporter
MLYFLLKITVEFLLVFICHNINMKKLLTLNACCRICGAAVVTWVSAAILVALFLLQRFGTNRIAFLFSPIMLMWFLVTPIVGVYNIAKYYPSIFKAISPHYLIQFFKDNKKDGWIALGGVVLCITGMCVGSCAQLILR